LIKFFLKEKDHANPTKTKFALVLMTIINER
jgi:hypothetical protein